MAGIDVSTLDPTELAALEEALVRRSRESADGRPEPAGPQMMSDVAWITDDWAFARPWEWVELVAGAIAQVGVLLGSAVISGAAAITGAHLLNGVHPHVGWFALAAAAFFGLVFLGQAGLVANRYRSRADGRQPNA